MKKLLSSYYGFYPIQNWGMIIHCDNCQYDGPNDPRKRVYFLYIATLVVLGILLFYTYDTKPIRIFISTRRFHPAPWLLAMFAVVTYNFCKTQKYYCPQCKAKEGIPLDLYRYLKR